MEDAANYFASTQLIMESLKCPPTASTVNRDWGGVQMCRWNGSIDVCSYDDVPDDILLVYHVGGTLRVPVSTNGCAKRSVSRPGLVSILHKHSSARWNVDGEFKSISLHISASHFRTPSTLLNNSRDPKLAFTDPFICTTLDVLVREMDRGEQNDPMFVRAMVEALISYIGHRLYAKSGSREPEGLRDKTLNDICDYIDSALENRLSVEELAGLADMRPSRFSRKFHHSTGKTPYQYVIERRLRLASKLLEYANEDISEIALRCGFSSQAHFSSAFKNSFGMTPAAYRRTSGL
ncbi:MAG: AraC family transcriptional regulator [Caenibius sp.]